MQLINLEKYLACFWMRTKHRPYELGSKKIFKSKTYAAFENGMESNYV